MSLIFQSIHVSYKKTKLRFIFSEPELPQNTSYCFEFFWVLDSVISTGCSLLHLTRSGGNLVHPGLYHALQHLLVDLGGGLQAFLKKERRYDMPLAGDNAISVKGNFVCITTGTSSMSLQIYLSLYLLVT